MNTKREHGGGGRVFPPHALEVKHHCYCCGCCCSSPVVYTTFHSLSPNRYDTEFRAVQALAKTPCGDANLLAQFLPAIIRCRELCLPSLYGCAAQRYSWCGKVSRSGQEDSGAAALMVLKAGNLLLCPSFPTSFISYTPKSFPHMLYRDWRLGRLSNKDQKAIILKVQSSSKTYVLSSQCLSGDVDVCILGILTQNSGTETT